MNKNLTFGAEDHTHNFKVVKTLLFTGSRDCKYEDYPVIQRATALAIEQLVDKSLINMSSIPKPPAQKIICRHGDAQGADKLFEEAVNKIARSMLPMGVVLEIDAHPYWKHLRKAGGPERNKHMINLEPKPSLCIAIKKRGASNRGTSGCMKLAEDAGINVIPYWS